MRGSRQCQQWFSVEKILSHLIYHSSAATPSGANLLRTSETKYRNNIMAANNSVDETELAPLKYVGADEFLRQQAKFQNVSSIRGGRNRGVLWQQRTTSLYVTALSGVVLAVWNLIMVLWRGRRRREGHHSSWGAVRGGVHTVCDLAEMHILVVNREDSPCG